MKILKWLYPKDIVKFKYWLHLALVVVFLETIFYLVALRYASFIGFSTDGSALVHIIISPMTLILLGALAISDVAAHSLLKMN